MSAAPQTGLDSTISILTDSPYSSDEAQASSLLSVTCEEQRARWQTIQLLSHYLASGTTRKRTMITKELEACRQLYEAVWRKCPAPSRGLSSNKQDTPSNTHRIRSSVKKCLPLLSSHPNCRSRPRCTPLRSVE